MTPKVTLGADGTPENAAAARRETVGFVLGDVMSANEAAQALSMSRNTVHKLAGRREDPFPLRYVGNRTRGAIVLRDEMLDWCKRNLRLGMPCRDGREEDRGDEI